MIYDDDVGTIVCIREPRCRLCSFGLREFDLFRIARWDNYFPLRCGTSQRLSEMILCSCVSDHCQTEFDADCYHPECWKFALDTYKTRALSEYFERAISPNFERATRFSFCPPLWGMQEKERAGRLRNLLAGKLKKEQWPMTLPNETWGMIASYLIRESVIVTAFEQTFGDPTPNSRIYFDKDVYAEYVMFEGIRYLKSVRNAGGPMGHRDTLILRGQDTGTIRQGYILEDHFGIRDVLFTADEEHQPPNRFIPLGVWVRHISDSDGIQSVRVRGDGLKVRDIVIGNDYECEPQNIARFRDWKAPPNTLLNIRTLEPLFEGFPKNVKYGGYPQMDSFDCNHPDIIGYSAAVGGYGVVAIFSHFRGSDFSMYGEVNPLHPVTWVYMPINQGELVTEICRFEKINEHIKTSYFGLMFITNHGRIGVLGDHRTLMLNTDFQRVYGPPSEPSKIFFDKGKGETMTLLAYESEDEPMKKEIPQSILTNRFRDYSSNSWYYTRCDMEGVTRIVPCRKSGSGPKQLIGALLEYEDGHKECMGEWRFDWATEPIRVIDNSGSLRLKRSNCLHDPFRGLSSCYDCVNLDIELVPKDAPPCEEDGCKVYIDMPWSGTWEWLFMEREHNGRTLRGSLNDQSMPPWYELLDDESDRGPSAKSD
ncbi:uncharacterized protein GGS22DRAFT_191411 [Annulohypoxylon maeteangense]|uniref:uncharacterized protein n=1 Tax=Annulohypoxylon maeteangense TaxID=1927788 RepID=UPI002007CE4F|nr:uncharacterized protein GGS22DRAFT_191411 [Annulohypoxylon maeteangense]KAI0882241.1 hypothetical protein GGS22DRAFT_191411 [Annulohypoxylon maeteangense]